MMRKQQFWQYMQAEEETMSQIYEEFSDYLEKMQLYSRAATLLYWDMETQMPKMGFEGHAKASAYFSTELFKLSTAPELKKYLDALAAPEEFEKLDLEGQFIVRRMKRDFERDSRVPEEFFARYVEEKNLSGKAWKEAKRAADFSLFAPHLAKMVEMTKQMAAYTDPGREVYDVLVDQFEEGMDSATIDRLFGELKEELIPLVQKVVSSDQPDSSMFEGHYDEDAQRKVQRLLLEYIGFDWNRGTVGETEHPFTLNFSSQDVRVTNHYYEEDPLAAMFSAIHEGGHAIFEQNVNPKLDGTVAGSCRYMGLHESQSRFYENILGRNKNFWVPIYGQVQNLLPGLQKISLNDFHKEINHVRNSMIRTEADELTYCFHIILRYEMEKAIFRDGVPVEELPGLWNKKMQEYLLITPQNDAEGILQDMHWSDGSFGYFPSYLLGSIYDGMFLEQMEKELGSVDVLLRDNRIGEITRWLNQKIHVYGSMRLSRDVLREVCGKEVTAQPLIRYFKEKYSALYGL